jgi:hypothetical protein
VKTESQSVKEKRMMCRRGGPRELTVEDTTIHDKRRQIILTQPEGDGVGTQVRRYKHLLTVWMASGRSGEDEDALSKLGKIIETEKTYHVFAVTPEMREK